MIAATGQLVSATWISPYQYNNKPENKPFSSHRFAKSRGWEQVSESCWHTGWGITIQSTSKTFVWTLQDWLLSALLLLTPLACFEAQDGWALISDISELPLWVTFFAIKHNVIFPQIDLKLDLSLIFSCFKAEIIKKKEGKKGCDFLGTLLFMPCD